MNARLDEISDGAMAVEILGESSPEDALAECIDSLVISFGEAAVTAAVKEKLGL